MTGDAPRKPAVSGVPPGADFVGCLHARLGELAGGMPPEDVARINVLLPTRRMQRRLRHLFEQSGNLLLPRVGLVSDVSYLLPEGRRVRPVAPLRRMLELRDVVARMVALDPRLSPSDVIDLTASLAALLDEMQGEGVGFDRIEALSPDDQSGHWAQSLAFLNAIRGYAEALGADRADPEALHRAEVERLIAHWEADPPEHPVILAGSTGSRATTRLLMTAVAALPRGEVILPGFDFDLPEDIWRMLRESPALEDHPQYRFASFLSAVGLEKRDVIQRGAPPNTARNALVSLALRPAPVTDAWLSEGPGLGDLAAATSGLTLIEARDTKEEAEAISLAMREALGNGKTVALIAPDATLGRRVTANLLRWGILPDDSGGMPLSLSPRGRFLRHTAWLAGGRCDPVELVALLKHPMTRAGADRGEHMLQVQEFELFLRRRNAPHVDADLVRAFTLKRKAAENWASWLASALAMAARAPGPTFGDAFAHHMAVHDAFAGDGLGRSRSTNDADEKVGELLERFREEAGSGNRLDFGEYLRLLDRALATESARDRDAVRPDAMIWGPLEARVQGADVVILGSLNEGVWPAQPSADPWLNRAMRRAAGLLLPERQIGLAAHDFQQAIGAKEVILSRSARSDGSETVPSRWLSRLANLLDGLEASGGKEALKGMRRDGSRFLHAAGRLDRPGGETTAAARPAPSPPVDMRPRTFAVTDIQKLIRDPYSIYARRILQLRPLDPLAAETDNRQRGTLFHAILEKFYHPDADFADPEAERARLREIADTVLSADCPDPTARVEWLGLFEANADWLVGEEMKRRRTATHLAREVEGTYPVPGTNFTLSGKADRIDVMEDGQLVIYDYKTGTPPERKEILRYDRQLVLEAVMAEAGAFKDIPPMRVAHVSHLGVGRSPKEQITELTEENDTVTVAGELVDFLNSVLDPEFGFVSGRAVETLRYEGDYDHLARFGEWDSSEPPEPEKLT